MPALTSSFLFDIESRWRQISVNDYSALTAAQNLWWSGCTKVIPSGSRREILSWILNTALLESQGKLGGNLKFDDMGMKETEFTPEYVGKGLKLRKAQFEDADGNGVELGTSWIRQITAQAAYWPQRQVANLLKNGHLATSLAYDGLPFFSASHLLNPLDSSIGTFSNLIASKPIDVSVTPEVALSNLSSVFGTIGSIKMPNGVDPRFLKPMGIMCSPVLYPRLVQITEAKFIAQTAGSGGGSADVEGLIRSMGYGAAINVPELAGFESDTTYFVLVGADGVPKDDLSGFVYLEREPFSVKFYTGQGGGSTYVDAVLDRAQELEWHSTGRNIAGYGHPYGVIKVKAGA